MQQEYDFNDSKPGCRARKRKSDTLGGGPCTDSETSLEPVKHRRNCDHSRSTKWDVSSSRCTKLESMTVGQDEMVSEGGCLYGSYGLMMVALRHPTLSIKQMNSATSAGFMWHTPLMMIEEKGVLGKSMERNVRRQ